MNNIPHMLTIFTDGASRGNPGSAACSFLIKDDHNAIIDSSVFFLGHTTNNVAEYTAVIRALTRASECTSGELSMYSDSQLVVRQITGEYRVTKPHLKTLFDEVISLSSRFSAITWHHVPREHPDISFCDRLCNEELDKH